MAQIDMRKTMGIFGTILALLGNAKADQQIHVEFINSSDGTEIGVVDLPLEKLPDSFAVDTTLDIADKKWSVTKAEPSTKAEFVKSKRLRVFLAPISMIPPRELLYSLPTISNDIGAGGGSEPPDETIFQINEDDWRQIEFVSKAFESQIDAECEEIREVKRNQRPGGGFTSVHIRKRIPTPLGSTTLSLAELEQILPATHRYKGVGIQRSLGSFRQSFAWDVDEGVTLWGTTDEHNNAHVICLAFNPKALHPNPDWLAAIGRFCVERNFSLVDWCSATKGSSPDEIRAMLSR